MAEMLEAKVLLTSLFNRYGDWSGNVYDFYTKVYMKIAPHLKKPFRLDGIYRIDDTPVHVAVREALVNCLSNADYFLSVPVKVELFPDRLVFSNPGTIRLGKKQMLHGGITSPRNKAILNMFNYIGVGERAGNPAASAVSQTVIVLLWGRGIQMKVIITTAVNILLTMSFDRNRSREAL